MFIINLILLWNILLSQQTLIQYQSYYYGKTENLDHSTRELVCKNQDLDYIKSLQNNKEVIVCCQISKDGLNHIDSCENFLAV